MSDSHGSAGYPVIVGVGQVTNRAKTTDDSIEPVELNLELRCRLDAASAPDPKALSARKLLRASTYKLLRILDRVSNPFDQHR